MYTLLIPDHTCVGGLEYFYYKGGGRGQTSVQNISRVLQRGMLVARVLFTGRNVREQSLP